MTHHAKIQQQRLIFTDPRKWESDKQQHEGKEVSVKLDEWKDPRSLPQNNLWHALIEQMAKELGYTPLEMKDVIKDILGQFGYVKPLKGDKRGVLIKVYHSSAKWTKETMQEIIDRTYQIAGEQGITLKSPEQYYEN